MNVPNCPRYRVPISGTKFLCMHPQVFAAGCEVDKKWCSLCTRHGDTIPAKTVCEFPALEDRTAACVHAGQPTGRVVKCPPCAGNVQIKTFHCAIFGECTPVKPVAPLPCCQSCPSYLRKE